MTNYANLSILAGPYWVSTVVYLTPEKTVTFSTPDSDKSTSGPSYDQNVSVYSMVANYNIEKQNM